MPSARQRRKRRGTADRMLTPEQEATVLLWRTP
jgi:hypothetical protein